MNKFKIYILITILLSIHSFGSSFDFKENCEKTTFVVTAYYSPKSGQVFYYKESFGDEKILNGNGTHGASGKPVFNGMLAAPSTYNFGGKIYFPSLGVGEIADRGGAIVHAGEKGDSHDRIDIWMGEGEEGLIRALTFGKRTIVGYYCSQEKLKSLGKNPGVGLNFDAIPILKYFFDSALFIQELKRGRTDIRVYKLQEYLMKFGYINKKTGFFGPETERAICNYQLKRGITSKKYCGVFGSLTRYYMKLESKKRGFLPDFGETTTFSDLIYYAGSYNGQDTSTTTSNKTPNNNYFDIAYKKGTEDQKVGELQDMLRHYGFYYGEISSNYDISTINSVHNFQVAVGVLSENDNTNPARGWMGPSTRSALNQKRIEFQQRKLSQAKS